MLLHLGIVVVAAPLLGLGLAARIAAPSTFGEARRWLLFAAAFEMLTVWGWHVPVLHDAAGRSTWLFALEQASFLAGGLGLWTAVFAAQSREAAGAAVIAAFFTFTHMTIFGLLLTLAPRLLYDPDLCQGRSGSSAWQTWRSAHCDWQPAVSDHNCAVLPGAAARASGCWFGGRRENGHRILIRRRRQDPGSATRRSWRYTPWQRVASSAQLSRRRDRRACRPS